MVFTGLILFIAVYRRINNSRGDKRQTWASESGAFMTDINAQLIYA